ncbi:PB1 domain-containing protein [Artemisia annua]|uniref:PB1 domain-containing protein n=1 Tax=Artemisia annua TaxID=35608 RepID=A0A2U1L3Y0_ARTAN|nr:PB1 domain-containing protein [Artemisia annua]
MASQLSEAEERERAFSRKGRWNHVRSLADAKTVMDNLFNLASSSRSLPSRVIAATTSMKVSKFEDGNSSSKKMIAICQYGGDFDTHDDGLMTYIGGEAYAIDLDENMQLSSFKQEIAETIDSTVDGMILKYFLPGNKKNLITVSKDKDFQRMVNYYKEADQPEVLS